jgi:hypothetical protein
MSNPLNPHLLPQMWIQYSMNYYENPSDAKPNGSVVSKKQFFKRFGSNSASVAPSSNGIIDSINIKKSSDNIRLRKMIADQENDYEKTKHAKKGTIRKSLSAREESINNFNNYKLLKSISSNRQEARQVNRKKNEPQENNNRATSRTGNIYKYHFGSTTISQNKRKDDNKASRSYGSKFEDNSTAKNDFYTRLLATHAFDDGLFSEKKSILFLNSNASKSESDIMNNNNNKQKPDKALTQSTTNNKQTSSKRKTSNLVLHKSFDQTKGCKGPQRKPTDNYMRHKFAAFQLGSITDAEVIRQQYRRDNALGKVPKINQITGSVRSFTQRSVDTMLNANQVPVSSLNDFSQNGVQQQQQQSKVFQVDSETLF